MSQNIPEKKESYVLFYSEKCGQSKKFINLLYEFPHINVLFEKLEIEKLATLGKLPPQLTHTPGIIDGNQLLMGSNAFKWLEVKTKEKIGTNPSLISKSSNGIGFSFIGESEDDYSPIHSNFEKPPRNGTDINPPQQQMSNPPPQQQMNHLPPQLQPIETNNESSYKSSTSGISLPPQLQPQTITNDNGKLSDGDMERYMASREQGIAIQR